MQRCSYERGDQLRNLLYAGLAWWPYEHRETSLVKVELDCLIGSLFKFKQGSGTDTLHQVYGRWVAVVWKVGNCILGELFAFLLI
jgi:hypothetical protein